MSESLRVEVTGDGSPTLFSSQFNAHYHSTHGALQESQHVFIDQGLEYWTSINPKKTVRILEFGMGTGLNALLTTQFATAQNVQVTYHGIEGYPLLEDSYELLNFEGIPRQALLELHQLPWERPIQWTDYMTVAKEKVLFEDFTPNGNFDILFYDAFAPSTQPHLWQEQILSKAEAAMHSGSVLVTFCAKGSFKRALKKLGLKVEGIPGPPGKREMTRATKI